MDSSGLKGLSLLDVAEGLRELYLGASTPQRFNGRISPHQARALEKAGDRHHHFNGRYASGDEFQDSRGRWYRVAPDGSHRRLRKVS